MIILELIFAGYKTIASYVFAICFVIGVYIFGYYRGEENIRQELIEKDYAHYVVNPKTGKSSYELRSPTAIQRYWGDK